MSSGLFSAEAFAVAAGIIGGLGIFLLGMEQISEGLQAVAGPRMRKLVAAATTNRFAGIFTGAIVTAIIQSSSVTTVMVVGMVTSGIMTLVQAINVIIGANIGTTMTAWLVATFPKIGLTAIMTIIGISAIVYLFAKREGWKYLGLIFLGLGLIFFGLDLISAALDPISQSQGLKDAMAMFSAVDTNGSFTAWGMAKCIFVGMVSTAIVQSSSATTGIAIILVTTGAIDFYTAATLVLGMNIGTTITAWLAALNAPTNARRAALAHSLFNIIGVIIMTPLFPIFLPIANEFFHVVQTNPDGTINTARIAFGVAGVHTAFNTINTCVFLPLVHPFAWIVEKIIPDPKVRENPRLTVMDISKLSPVVAVEQARKEVEYMSKRCDTVIDTFRTVLTGDSNDESEQEIIHTEDALDTIQHEVSGFLGIIMSKNLPSDVALRARMLLRVADEYESVSDDIAALLRQAIRMRKSDCNISALGKEEILSIHDMCRAFATMVTDAFREGKAHAPNILAHMRTDAATISARIKEIRKAQLGRLSDASVNPLCVVILLDVLNIYRRLKEDFLNIGEAMLDEAH